MQYGNAKNVRYTAENAKVTTGARRLAIETSRFTVVMDKSFRGAAVEMTTKPNVTYSAAVRVSGSTRFVPGTVRVGGNVMRDTVVMSVYAPDNGDAPGRCAAVAEVGYGGNFRGSPTENLPAKIASASKKAVSQGFLYPVRIATQKAKTDDTPKKSAVLSGFNRGFRPTKAGKNSKATTVTGKGKASATTGKGKASATTGKTASATTGKTAGKTAGKGKASKATTVASLGGK